MKRKAVIYLIIPLVIFWALSCRVGGLVQNYFPNEPTPVAMAVRLRTVISGATPMTTNTLLPTTTPTATLKPSSTQTRTPTKRPTPRPSLTLVPPTPQPRSRYNFKVDQIRCLHSGQSFVEGLVLDNPDINSGLNGMRVRMSTEAGGLAIAPDALTEDHYLKDSVFYGNFSGYYAHIVNANGPAPGQVRYVWVVDASGKPLSDPSSGKATFNNEAENSPTSCWNVQIIFVKFQ